jgi:hypothetical protein
MDRDGISISCGVLIFPGAAAFETPRLQGEHS